ncbi:MULTISPECIES: serine/threonine protein kinase [unclassified Coleofasciculus]|uniref:serine/threonine protein kinase n=1 Tax=unclassified Coleofasciculus TaxID=2692782 RepID=UPI0018809486|nr:MULTISPECIES: serine/threonine-protein kinase [unclassified Coleofasciculus]MBE9126965.1 serine/threonine protein kinase [Coleofasciculus sp. LEGE 07081]MBE9150272.1 serine/threonine protein kinase [Coleofasciculus sp. LEGE 07092]
MEQLHQPGEMITQRYRILNLLGQGGVGTTYAAKDLKNNQNVALKVLSLRRMADWKKMELFEREARILAQLNHPGIPRYLDYFQVDTSGDLRFYIAQQLAPGKSLAVLVERGWHPDETQVKQLALRVLNILIYLHQLVPPVIHRDIKPQNIILNRQGRVFLVDFGAVQDTYHHTVTGGSTIVGTYGYMAPEQFRGQAVLSTDLYGLGTTLVFLLTHQSPADLPQRQLKLDFRPYVHLSKEFADWLEKMLEPIREDRFAAATEALAVLQGKQALIKSSRLPRLQKPKDSPIRLIKSDNTLSVEIPPIGLRTKPSQLAALINLVWNGLLVLTIGMVIKLSLFLQSSNLIPLGVCVVIGMWLLTTFLYCTLSKIEIEVSSQTFQLQKWLLGSRYQNVQGTTRDINQIELREINLPLSKKSITFCHLRLRGHKPSFGIFLTPPEKEWLVREIGEFVEKWR